MILELEYFKNLLDFGVLWIRWEKLLVKKLSRNVLKTASKGATSDLIGNKIANKITNVSRTSSDIVTNWTQNIGLRIKIPKKDIYLQKKKRKKVIDDIKINKMMNTSKRK